MTETVEEHKEINGKKIEHAVKHRGREIGKIIVFPTQKIATDAIDSDPVWAAMYKNKRPKQSKKPTPRGQSCKL